MYIHMSIWIYPHHGQQMLKKKKNAYQITTDSLWITSEYTIIFKLRIYNNTVHC